MTRTNRTNPRQPTSPGARPVLTRLASLTAAVIALGSAVVAATMLPNNTEWIPAWLGLAAVFGAASRGLWQGKGWAHAFALGLSLWGLVCFVESSIVAGICPFFVVGTVLHAGLVGLLLLTWRGWGLHGRLAFTTAAVGAALPCAALYALAPQQSWTVTLGVLGGALVLAAGTWGICRGRTWGLLAALAGAVGVVLTITEAAALGWLQYDHVFLPSSNPLALQVLGLAAAVLAVAAVAPWLGSMLRFLVRGPR